MSKKPYNPLMKIFFLGPEGTNSDLAARNIFKDNAKFVPLPSIEDIFEKVAMSHSYYGVIPFENSYQGVINSSLNCLIDYDLKILREFNFSVSHHLCSANTEFDLHKIKKITSHPQVFGQCNNWIRNNLPDVEKVVATSTAEAASKAVHDNEFFCIANSYAIELFNLHTHLENIQDSNDNKTRFLVIGKSIEEKADQNKTSVMINIADKPGSLMSILQPFTELNINMTRIETRPSRNNDYLHTFFIDFEGYYEDEIIIKLLEKLEKMSEELRIIGSYSVLN
jgi:chorismate mutase/prephenate dehydratase|tara:strand:- start:2108 stop:2950 length:843 start_codon:yes stop_codon:yes gene_type:complete